MTSTSSCVNLTMSGGVYVVDGTVTGLSALGAGNAAVNGSVKDITHTVRYISLWCWW